MMIHHCWHGRLLHIDLENEKVTTNKIPGEVYERFIGGKGLGTYLLYTLVEKGVDPLGAENSLFFLTGPLQGLRAPNVGRWSLMTKSPLTGLYLDSHCGGALGREIKNAGYDAMQITGKAERPVVLQLRDDEVELQSAGDLWGKGTVKTTRILAEKTDRKSSVYAIGPAGENLVKFATGCCELAHQTGRGGAGAVMGSKNLKAIVARGTGEISAADPDALREVNREVAKSWAEKKNYGFKDLGTGFLPEVANGLGQFPTRNWRSGFFEDYESLDMYKAEEEYGLGAHHSCPHCIMRCTRAYKTGDPNGSGTDVESMVEYETLGLMGGNLAIEDVQSVLKLNYLSDDYGLDTISAGGVIGFAMEAFEEGLISEEDLGFELAFGDAQAAIDTLRLIVSRNRIGDKLAEGVKAAAESLGAPAIDLAVHVKGLECAAWDPRGRRCMGLSYATADVGASHLRGWPGTTDPPDGSAVELVESMVRSRNEKLLTDSLEVCHFTYHLPLSFEQKIRLLNGATGLHYDEADMMEFAERVATLSRLFNYREGITRQDDTLPKKFWTPQEQGPREGMKAFVDKHDFEKSLDKFYELRGWNENGVPTSDRIQELGLSDVVKGLP
ncbi:aldehyde ferredoxin oxidoreductase [Candidatus Thorarchaeota archaeon]|nr:MAG: aldehyde ferredoxin oxidoreductase [Candidatus Thorarchaeota archaeon]